MSEGAPIRVLIADDHHLVLEGLALIVGREPGFAVVGKARDGVEAVELFRHARPDVTLMDLQMPRLDGVEAIRAICSEVLTARILVLTTFDGDEDIYRGLRAGARGYLLKDEDPAQLLVAIRTVHAGRKYIPAEIALKLADRISGQDLTEREVEVLREMTAGRSNLEIAGALRIAEGTVKFHVNNILAKLGVNDRTQAVTSALRRGIVRL
jgi:DNA-binding NarL/FixJ family response regulator